MAIIIIIQIRQIWSGWNMKLKRLLCGLCVSLLLLSFFAAPGLSAVGEEEINQVAESYKFEDETFEIYGPYTYAGHPYKLIRYSPAENEMTTSVLVIDSETGEIITDTNLAEKIITVFVVSLIISPQYISGLEYDSGYFASYQNMMSENVKSVESTSIAMRSISYLGLISVCQKSSRICSDLKENTDARVVIAKKIDAGDKSYENAKQYLELEEKQISLMEELTVLLEEFEVQSIIYYDSVLASVSNSDRNAWERSKAAYIEDVDITMNQTVTALKTEKELFNLLEAYIVFSTEAMKERLPEEETATKREIPGFGILIAVCAILAAGILIKRR